MYCRVTAECLPSKKEAAPSVPEGRSRALSGAPLLRNGKGKDLFLICKSGRSCRGLFPDAVWHHRLQAVPDGAQLIRAD